MSPAPLEIHMLICAFLPGHKILCKVTDPALQGRRLLHVSLAAEFSGSEIHFHFVFKNWHQICKWLLCELCREALSKSLINNFQREMAMYFPCALALLPSAKHQPSALAHPCTGASAQAWLKHWFEAQQILLHISK